MTLILPGVLVPSGLVGSSGFRARTGEPVTVGLEAYCLHRVVVSEDDHAVGAVPVDEPGGGLVLTGTAVLPVSQTWLGGWVLDVDGVPFHVTEAQAEERPRVVRGGADRLPGSDPADPLPSAADRVRLRGVVSVADGYVVDDVEEGWQLHMPRPWFVQRVVRLRPTGRGPWRGQSAEFTDVVEWTADTSSYLLDLARPG